MAELSLDERAILMHEVYTSFVRAGFSEDQAMMLLFNTLDRANEDERRKGLPDAG